MFLNPAEVIQELKAKKCLLFGMVGADFGCGGGYFTSLLASEVGPEGKIYAIDVQEDALKEAQEFLKNLNITNVRFLHQDLEKNCGLNDSSVDFVFISQVLYQSETPENIIKEAKRALKTNGYLIIIEPRENNPLFLGQKVYSSEKLLDFINAQNFKIEDFKTIGEYYLIIAVKQ